MTSEYIYHITTPEDWAKFQDEDYYETESLKTEGFIHNSTQEQARVVANRFFVGNEKIVLIKIEKFKLEAVLKYELAKSENQYFPHIYGRLNKSAIVEIAAIPCKEDGQFDW